MGRSLKVITSHINADFDAFASMIAASKFYPDAKIVFSGSHERTLREFLKKEGGHYRFLKASSVDISEITLLVLVDVRKKGKIGPFKDVLQNKGVEVHIYDHHPAGTSTINGKIEVVKKRGATTTIMVEGIRKKKIVLSKREATVMAMGIYEETGCLTYSSTTIHDLKAVGWLLDIGADLKPIREYFRREINEEQLSILNQLLSSSILFKRKNLAFALATATEDLYVDDAALSVTRAMDMKGLDAIAAVIRMDERIHLIFRSSTELFNCSEAASFFGGGGHNFAASAVVKGMTVVETTDRIKAYFESIMPSEIKAGELMTLSPLTIPASFSMGKALSGLNRLHFNVAPVVSKEGKVTGIINRKILEKAVSHGMAKDVVGKYVNCNYASVNFDTPAQDVIELMIRDKIPFVTVSRKKELKGVITRSDLIKHMSENRFYADIRENENSGITLEREAFFRERNVKRVIEERMTKDILEHFEIVKKIADERQINAYLVGGVVRDILLGMDNYDIDIVLESDGISFSREFAKRVAGKIKSHGRFGTSSVFMSSGFRIDIATARTEFYESPAKLPVVSPGSLKRDLFRRDFSINALAVRLNGKPSCVLIDYFGGQRDLKDRVIRVLHSLSFVEDPTRIFRALRFEARLGFKIGKQTLALLKDSLSKGVLGKVSGKRILAELMLIFKEKKNQQILKRMWELKLLQRISPYLSFDTHCEDVFKRTEKVIDWYEIAFPGKKILIWQIHLMALCHRLGRTELKTVSDRLSIPSGLRKKLRTSIEAESVVRKLQKAVNPSDVYELLKGFDKEVILFIMSVAERDSVINRISEYFTRYSTVKKFINGDDLKKLGITEGPLYSKILSEVHRSCIDGLVNSKKDELQLAEKLFRKYKNLPPS